MTFYILNIITLILLIISFVKSKSKTKQALKKTIKSLITVGIPLITIVIIVSIFLSIFSTETITKLIGEDSGILGVFFATIIGSLALIPSPISFNLASTFLLHGAGLTQVSVFVSTLTLVVLTTIPMEIEYFGKSITRKRNIMTLIFAIIIGITLGAIL